MKADSGPEEKGHEGEGQIPAPVAVLNREEAVVEGDEDSCPPSPPPSVDEQYGQILAPVAAPDKEEAVVEGDEDSCPPSTTPSIDEEHGEADLVVALSTEEDNALSLPSRIDSLWVPRTLKIHWHRRPHGPQ